MRLLGNRRMTTALAAVARRDSRLRPGLVPPAGNAAAGRTARSSLPAPATATPVATTFASCAISPTRITRHGLRDQRRRRHCSVCRCRADLACTVALDAASNIVVAGQCEHRVPINQLRPPSPAHCDRLSAWWHAGVPAVGRSAAAESINALAEKSDHLAACVRRTCHPNIDTALDFCIYYAWLIAPTPISAWVLAGWPPRFP